MTSTSDSYELLWHGTSGDKLHGILSEGLKMQASPRNGRCLGEGIYFTDCAAYAIQSAVGIGCEFDLTNAWLFLALVRVPREGMPVICNRGLLYAEDNNEAAASSPLTKFAGRLDLPRRYSIDNIRVRCPPFVETTTDMDVTTHNEYLVCDESLIELTILVKLA